MERFEEPNYYEILEIPFDASSTEINRAYRNAVAVYSEDSLLTYSLFTSEEREEILKKLEDAYDMLIDDTKRRGYDNRLRLCQTNDDDQEQMHRELIQVSEHNQFGAYSHYVTNKGQPNTVARTSNTEIGANLLSNSVKDLESGSLKKYLVSFFIQQWVFQYFYFFSRLSPMGNLPLGT